MSIDSCEHKLEGTVKFCSISREAIHETFTIPDAPKYWCHKINKTALKPNDSFMQFALGWWVINAWWCSANMCAITNANTSHSLPKNYSVLSCYRLSPSKSTDTGFMPSSAKPNLQFMLIKLFSFLFQLNRVRLNGSQSDITHKIMTMYYNDNYSKSRLIFLTRVQLPNKHLESTMNDQNTFGNAQRKPTC